MGELAVLLLKGWGGGVGAGMQGCNLIDMASLRVRVLSLYHPTSKVGIDAFGRGFPVFILIGVER